MHIKMLCNEVPHSLHIRQHYNLGRGQNSFFVKGGGGGGGVGGEKTLGMRLILRLVPFCVFRMPKIAY